MSRLKVYTSLFPIFFVFFLFPKIANAQVVINEMSTWETSGDWVELYSPEDVDISGWKLRDSASSVIQTVPQGISIGPSGSKYYVLQAGNRLNRDTDTIKLLKSDDLTLVDEIDYGGNDQVCAPGSGETIGRYPDGGSTLDRFAASTQNASNDAATLNACPTPTPTPSPSPTQSPTATAMPTPSPSPSHTPKPTLSPTKSPTPTKNEETADNPAETNSLVLGLRDELNDKGDPTASAETEKNFPLFAVGLSALGLGFIAFAIFVFLKGRKKVIYNEGDEKSS